MPTSFSPPYFSARIRRVLILAYFLVAGVAIAAVRVHRGSWSMALMFLYGAFLAVVTGNVTWMLASLSYRENRIGYSVTVLLFIGFGVLFLFL
jgi:hypothetical protein